VANLTAHSCGIMGPTLRPEQPEMFEHGVILLQDNATNNRSLDV
jgi:hypothetical protein